MEIKKGMYAYSKTCRDYGIGKIVDITENGQGFKGDLIDIQYKYSERSIKEQDVIASFNLIDLIKVGDYVNGYRVYSGGKNHFDYILTWYEENDYYMKIELLIVDIKSIVTKEQFNSMKYEVGE